MQLHVRGQPTFLLGVNYWSRRGGPLMWEQMDEQTVRRELRQMRGIGLNCCRSFCYLPSFMPRPPQLSRAALDRLDRFLELCSEEQMWTVPTFLVGHMSGENYDFPGQGERSLYSDPELLSWQQELVRQVGGIGAAHESVLAYLASNEMPLWGGHGATEEIVRWARSLRDALRQVESVRPFSLGDGVMNLQGGQNGFDPLALHEIVDFVGPHTYFVDTDPLRQAFNAELCVRSLTHLGLPVVLEEFGCSSTQASEHNQALYYRETIHSCLSAGAAGALGWCFTDFDLVEQRPYRFQGFELGFGITRSDGSEKPVCDELRAISALIHRIGFPAMRPSRPRAAILVPSYFNTTYPFSREDRRLMRAVLLQAYALCGTAGIEAELLPEEALEGPARLDDYRLVLAPATQKLLSPTWQALLRWVERGNTLYWSYHAGEQEQLHGAWCYLIDRLCGCRHQLRYGCLDLPVHPLRVTGADLEVEVATGSGAACGRSFLPIEPVTATVLARDAQGAPALVRARHGQGKVLFLNHPLERHMALQPDVTPRSGAHQLYRLLAREAGVASSMRVEDPRLQLRQVPVADAPALLWIFNRSWDTVESDLDAAAADPLHGAAAPLIDGAQRIRLTPKQVAVYRLR